MSDAEAKVRIYDRRSEKLLAIHAIEGLAEFEGGRAIFDAPLAHATQRFWVGSDKGLYLHDALSGNRLRAYPDLIVHGMAWTRGYERLGVLQAPLPMSGATSSTLTFYECDSTGELKGREKLFIEGHVRSWAVDWERRRVATIDLLDDGVRLYELEAGTMIWKIPGVKFGAGLDLSPDGKYIAAGGEKLSVIDANNPERRRDFSGFENNIDTIRFTRDGHGLVVTSYLPGQVRLYQLNPDVFSLELAQEFRQGANVYGAIFYAGGTRMMTSGGNRMITFYGLPKE